MNVGFIGLGRMGSGMASRILSGGHDLAVFDAVASQVAPLQAAGARTASSVAEVCAGRDVLVTMLVAGVWHGTTLNFAVFGLIHGVALVVVRAYEQIMVRRMGRAAFRRFAERPLVTASAVFLTYNFTSLAYVFFVLDVGESVRVVERLAVTAAGLVP